MGNSHQIGTFSLITYIQNTGLIKHGNWHHEMQWLGECMKSERAKEGKKLYGQNYITRTFVLLSYQKGDQIENIQLNYECQMHEGDQK